MKDFLKFVGATIVGLILFGVIVSTLTVMSVVGMVAASDATQKVEKNSVLVLKLDGILQEQAVDDIQAKLSGNSTLALNDILSAIKKAKNNDNIKGIYIEAGYFGADLAQMQEIRDALEDFKKTKKWIVAYGNSYSAGTYYLASLADKIYLNPLGVIDWSGMGSYTLFLKNTLDKVGVTPYVFKCGKYKSAVEPFIAEKMSDPSREQMERFTFGSWQVLTQAVSKSRGISVDTLNAYADRMIVTENPFNYEKYKLVDKLLYPYEVKREVKKRLKIDEDESINQISVSQMANVPEKSEGDEIAVYYAYGAIVSTPTPQDQLLSGTLMLAQTVIDDLEDLANDDDVKAVVLRINSPGGDAYASEQIWKQIEVLKTQKPVVVSMSGMAASGGYYISSGANYIFAEPTTLTGSIGVFGMFFNYSNLLSKKLGVTIDGVKTNRNVFAMSPHMPWTEEQMKYIQRDIDRTYEIFKNRVALGRNMTMAQVEPIAQGHVYLGMDAKKLGLVDALGGLDQAVAKAAQLAKVEKYHAEEYPTPPDFMEQLLDATEDYSNNYLDERMKMALGDLYEPVMMARSLKSMEGIQARMPFMLQIKY